MPRELDPPGARRVGRARRSADRDHGVGGVEEQPGQPRRVGELRLGEPQRGAQLERVGQHAQRLAGRGDLDGHPVRGQDGHDVHLVDDRHVAGQPVGQQHGLVVLDQDRRDPSRVDQGRQPGGDALVAGARRDDDHHRLAAGRHLAHRARGGRHRTRGRRPSPSPRPTSDEPPSVGNVLRQRRTARDDRAQRRRDGARHAHAVLALEAADERHRPGQALGRALGRGGSAPGRRPRPPPGRCPPGRAGPRWWSCRRRCRRRLSPSTQQSAPGVDRRRLPHQRGAQRRRHRRRAGRPAPRARRRWPGAVAAPRTARSPRPRASGPARRPGGSSRPAAGWRAARRPAACCSQGVGVDADVVGGELVAGQPVEGQLVGVAAGERPASPDHLRAPRCPATGRRRRARARPARSRWCGTSPRSPRRCRGCAPAPASRPSRAGRRCCRAAGRGRG